MNIIDGKKISNKIKEELITQIKNIKDKLKLVVIEIGNDPASKIYVANKKKLCLEIGINCEILKYDNIEEKVLIEKIQELNNDDNVTGILVQLPLPNYLDKNRIINTISKVKDVDGLTNENLSSLFINNNCIIPCTAYGILKIFEYENINLEGKNITLIGRSKLSCYPLIPLLINKNATVTICHSKTTNLKEKTLISDILIVGVGKSNFITKDMVKDNAIIIDVGINRIDNKITGDVSYNEFENSNISITPVPGGVGPMTVIMLANNIIECYKQKKSTVNNF